MSKSLGVLTLDLVAKTGGYVNGLSKSERETEKWRRKVEGHAKAAGTAIGASLAVGAVAATAAITSMVRSSLEAIDAQAKLAQRMRTSYDSLSNLARAGELAGVSMQQIEVASRSLELNLGKAAQGSKAQADALALLKLNADEVSALPLDRRIQVINEALKENVSQTERAAVAAELFGSRGALAIQMLDPATIAEAARQVEIFGLNLSDIDAAKIELAGDALSNFGLLSQGISTQLTVELAPVLQAIGDEFLRVAEEAGGMANAVNNAVLEVLRPLAFMADSVAGVGRVLDLLEQSASMTFNTIAGGIAEVQSALLATANNGPLGFLFNSETLDDATRAVEEYSAARTAAVQEASSEFARLMADPLPGTKLLAFYDKTQKAGQAAAEANVAARVETGEYNKVLGGTVAELKNVQVTAKKLELSEHIKKAIEAQEDYNSLVSEMRTEEEVLNDTLEKRLALLKAVGQLDSETAARVAAAAFTAAPEYQGLAPEIGGAAGEFAKINGAKAALDDWYQTQLDMLAEYRKTKSELNAQWDEQEIAKAQEYAEKLAEIDQARMLTAYAASEELFGSLAGLTKQFAGEQSTAYKVLFAAEKAAAIARSIVAIQTAIAQASTSQPFPANLAAMASVAAATASIISTITSTGIQGQAHDGLMSVPQTGTYLLEKGERVTTEKTSAKLDRTLEEVRANQSGGMGSVTNMRIINAFDAEEVLSGFLGSRSGEKAVMNIVSRNRRTIQSFKL